MESTQSPHAKQTTCSMATTREWPSNYNQVGSFHPLVSIIIPVYNGGNYLREAVESALSQTYSHCEVIIVNDGSRDNEETERIARSYGDNIRYIAKSNGGVASALNAGIAEMRGEYFSWLSHDDVYEPHKISEQIEYLCKSKNKKTIVYSNYSLINELSQTTGIVDFSVRHPPHKCSIPYYAILNGLIHGCSLLIHHSLFNEHGLFNEELRTTQDYDLWYRMFPNCAIAHLNKPLVRSRQHAEQDSKKHQNAKREANDLWKRMISGCPRAQMLLMEGSISEFYRKAIATTKGAGYLDAQLYIEDLLNRHQNAVVDIKNIKVSIIIPFYNRIDLLLEAVSSAISQTHKNVEIIAVDDSSTENLDPIKNLALQHPNILRLYTNQRNRGASGARNHGITKATGDFIAFLDADDIFMPGKVEAQLSFMVLNDCSITYTSYITFSDKKSEVREAPGVYTFPDVACGALATPTVMMRRELLQDLKFAFSETIHIGEDMCLWIDLSRYFNIFPIPQPLSLVRLHGANAAYDPVKLAHGVINILQHVGSIENIRAHPNIPLKLIAIIKENLLSIMDNKPCSPEPLHQPPSVAASIPHSEPAPFPITGLSPREVKLVKATRKLARVSIARTIFHWVAKPCYRAFRNIGSKTGIIKRGSRS